MDILQSLTTKQAKTPSFFSEKNKSINSNVLNKIKRLMSMAKSELYLNETDNQDI